MIIGISGTEEEQFLWKAKRMGLRKDGGSHLVLPNQHNSNLWVSDANISSADMPPSLYDLHLLGTAMVNVIK